MSLSIIGVSESCIAETAPCYSSLSEVLSCFIKHEDNAYSYQKQYEINLKDIKHETYILTSQIWPIEPNLDIESTIWKHKLHIYIPEVVKFNKAMLYVGGGYSYNDQGATKFNSPLEILDFANIAKSNNAIVVSLEDVPNQYLLMNSTYKKEDQILAFTYKKVMQDPFKNAYLAGHLPMVKSIVKAMDATQEILSKQNIQLDEFMLVGASKRGWASWLAAIEDKRISALIPIVIDILNVQKNIGHICSSYKDYCPPALRDYKAEGITNSINTEAFGQLMQIEDPFAYINSPSYSKQFSIPKYIINSSGDDFYVADSSKFYFKNLPGENYIRFLPQAMHYLAGNYLSNVLGNMAIVNNAVNNYFYFHINNVDLPQVNWEFVDNKIVVSSSLKPEKIKLWSANNENARDFRCIHSYDKTHLYWKIGLAYLYKALSISKPVCDAAFIAKDISPNCDKQKCQIEIETPEATKGWQASFVELLYNIKNKPFIVTTEILIKPQ